MLEDSYQQQHTLTWNTARGVWELTQANLLCEHLEPFLGTWQTSGTMRNGQVFGLQMPEHHTTDSECSSLPTQMDLPPVPEEAMLRTPSAIEGQGGAISEKKAKEKNRMLQVRDQMAQLAHENGLKVSAAIAVDLLPTPVAIEGIKGTAAQGSEEKGKTGQVWLTNIAHDFARQQGLPTPARQNGLPQPELPESAPLSWGKFEPAIRRWELVLGRPAPAPTKPDGKDGSHRLSSAFTEWMMGLPEGWVTDCGLSRVDELKACGNGVVPQQAEMALRILLEGVDLGNE